MGLKRTLLMRQLSQATKVDLGRPEEPVFRTPPAATEEAASLGIEIGDGELLFASLPTAFD